MHVCRVECGSVSMLKHSVVTLPSHTSLTHAQSSHTLHSHTHAHSPPGGQVSSSTTAEASAYRGRGGGGGGGGAPPEQDGQPMDEYQGPHEGVYMHTHTVLAPKDVSS